MYILYDFFEFLVVTVDSIAQLVSFVDSLLCFLVDDVLSLVHLFDLSFQTSHSHDDVFEGAIHLLVFFLPFSDLFLVLLQRFG